MICELTFFDHFNHLERPYNRTSGVNNRNAWLYVKSSKTLAEGIMILLTVYCNLKS